MSGNEYITNYAFRVAVRRLVTNLLWELEDMAISGCKSPQIRSKRKSFVYQAVEIKLETISAFVISEADR